ncbi:MAG: septum formation inhibitor Maf [Clostridiales bacterium]|nr:septum formation inhibitor Maf [Clostridiales bacterium]
MEKKLILASASPRRREILAMAGYRFDILSPDVDENISGLPPAELVQELSRRKAAAAAALTDPANVILAADTVVSLDGEILGKPTDSEDAAAMLARLSGRTHAVYTGITLRDSKNSVTQMVAAQVTMRDIAKEEIDAYVATGSPLDKAGAYGIQEAAGMFVREIQGDFYCIMGLPLCPVSVILRDTFGMIPDLSNTTIA